MKRISKNKREEIIKAINRLENLCQETKYMVAWQPGFFRDKNLFPYKRRYFLVGLSKFINGLYYGYPLCCVWFFVTKWNKVCKSGVRKNKKISLGHIPCNRCYKRELKKNT